MRIVRKRGRGRNEEDEERRVYVEMMILSRLMRLGWEALEMSVVGVEILVVGLALGA